jgi:hypothetical protein
VDKPEETAIAQTEPNNNIRIDTENGIIHVRFHSETLVKLYSITGQLIHQFSSPHPLNIIL